MGERADRIKDQIEHERQDLGENLQELENKVRDTMDWRAQFEQHPMMGVGLAFASGFLLSAMMPGGSDSGSEPRREGRLYDTSAYRVNDEPQAWKGAAGQDTLYASSYSPPPRPKQRSVEMREVSETIENIRGAVMGMAASKLRTFLSEAVPGFEQEYEEARRKRGNSEETRIRHDSSDREQTREERRQAYRASGSTGTATAGMTAEQAGAGTPGV